MCFCTSQNMFISGPKTSKPDWLVVPNIYVSCFSTNAGSRSHNDKQMHIGFCTFSFAVIPC